jgi:hypothetical protein
MVRKIDFRTTALRPDTEWLQKCTGVTYLRLQDGLIQFNSLHIAAMPLTFLHLYSFPAGSTLTLAAADFDGWPNLPNLTFSNCGLLTAQVNAILQGLYAGLLTRVSTGGIVSIAGNSQAPSGTYEAECPTPSAGKQAAYNLLYDPCGVAPTKKWTTITVTGGLP